MPIGVILGHFPKIGTIEHSSISVNKNVIQRLQYYCERLKFFSNKYLHNWHLTLSVHVCVRYF